MKAWELLHTLMRLMSNTRSTFFLVIMALRRLIYVKRDNRAQNYVPGHYVII